ncbi:hypothetical protein BDN70DRAFT_583910 [Pholiota conissans]|uniref:F-box domain-containing protein n=1 Tax=Pholiota conissans TaxID=109636 RepID=A0A9P5Z649_9AGAR|nr:hypothetical protein BDN70DRAFT_583910 [Pholiota conissans]
MTGIQSLPLEIIDDIIENSALTDDKKLSNVKACALTCRIFHFCSRKQIFANVTLNSRKGPPRLLQELLTTTPAIGECVRKLKFSLFVYDDKELSSPEFPELLKKFTQVRHLVISNASTAFVVWDAIPRGIRDILHRIMHLPTFQYLQFICVQNFPWRSLADCATLKRLHLDSTLAGTAPIFPASATTPSLPLINLREYNMDFQTVQITRKIFGFDGPPVFDIRHLKRMFAFCHDSPSVVLTREMLKKTSQLTFLHLRTFEGCCPGLSLMLSPVLLSLKKFDFLDPTANKTPDYIDVFIDEFESIRGQHNVLEELDISIYLDIPRDSASALIVKEKLGALDKTLDTSGWMSLKTVSIDIVELPNHSLKSDDFIPSQPREFFPVLSSDKRCRVQFLPHKPGRMEKLMDIQNLRI